MMSPKPILPSKRFWWIGMALLLVAGALLFYTHYDFSLPYIDHADEPSHNLAAQMIIDDNTAKSISMHAYPPGIITVNYLALRLFHDQTGLPSEILGSVRLISITFSWLTLISVALVAYHLMDEIASLLTTFIWMSTPLIVVSSRYAVADSYLTFFSVTAILLTYLATVYNRHNFATLGLLSLMLGIVFKTQAIFLLPIVFGFPFLRLYTIPNQRRVIVKYGLGNGLRLALFMIWLLLLYPTLEANASPNWSAPTGKATIPTILILRHNLDNALGHLQPLSIWGLALIPYILAIIPQYRQRVQLLLAFTLFSAAAAWLVGISIFGMQSARQMYALYTFLLILTAGSLYLLARVLFNQLYPYVKSMPYIRMMAVGGVVISLAFFSLPYLQEDVEHIQSLSYPDVRVHIANYIDTSLPPAPFIATWSNHKTLNPAWGGIPLTNSYQFVKQANVFDRPLTDWQAQDVAYALVPSATWQEAKQDGRADGLDVTVLNTFPPSMEFRGGGTVILYLDTPTHALDQQLGSIRYVGYDRNADTLMAGETLHLRFFWQAEQPTETANQLFIHISGADSSDIVAQLDVPPLYDARRNTTTWDDPKEILLGPVMSILISKDIPPGTYHVRSGFYDPSTGVRQTTPSGADAVELFELTIEPTLD